MARSARYEKLEPQTEEEKLLLRRIEELEEQMDKMQTCLTEHKHNGPDVIIDATWLF